MIEIILDTKGVTRALSDLARKQLPYATARALTKLADRVVDAQRKALPRLLDRPRPFTIDAIRRLPAGKTNLVATVYVKDIAAQYLAPFEFGGTHFLGKKRGMLVPRDIRLNQYGNIPRNTLARLRAQKDVFIGPVKFKTGETINGVWRRGGRGQRRRDEYGTKGNNKQKFVAARTTLTLLIQFTAPGTVTPRLHYFDRAQKVVSNNFRADMTHALADALRTAK